ncbi:hypothetical protein PG987_012274 [Apiospora arundinis]
MDKVSNTPLLTSIGLGRIPEAGYAVIERHANLPITPLSPYSTSECPLSRIRSRNSPKINGLLGTALPT